MVKGLNELKRKLTVELPRDIDIAVRASMEKGAQELVDMMKRLCPVDRGDLRDSIGWTWGEAPKGAKVYAASGNAALRLIVYAGNDRAFYARMVEFGTMRTPAQPFFFPSYRSMRTRIKRRIIRELKKAVKKNSATESTSTDIAA